MGIAIKKSTVLSAAFALSVAAWGLGLSLSHKAESHVPTVVTTAAFDANDVIDAAKPYMFAPINLATAMDTGEAGGCWRDQIVLETSVEGHPGRLLIKRDWGASDEVDLHTLADIGFDEQARIIAVGFRPNQQDSAWHWVRMAGDGAPAQFADGATIAQRAMTEMQALCVAPADVVAMVAS